MNPQPSLMTTLTQGMAQGSSPLNQVTPAAPTYQPSLAPQAPSPMPNKSPETMMHLHNFFKKNGIQVPQQLQGMVTLPVEDQNLGQPGVQVPASEAELIIKAMDTHLKHKDKMESKKFEATQSPMANL